MRIARSVCTIVGATLIAAAPVAASAQVSVGVGIGFGGPGWGVGVTAGYPPPALPAYSIPPAPYPGWQLVPGYWGWGSAGYYWVPAYWTAPPVVGDYWTPGYWGYVNGAYLWNAGYWGPSVGFYGGINYGFGYFGTGFVGGFWSGGTFNYNTAVVRVNRTVIHNTYVNKRVIDPARITRSRVSYNGGRGGVHARPTRAQLAARRHAVPQTVAQRAHERVAAHAYRNARNAPVGHHNAPVLTTHQSMHVTYRNPAAAHPQYARPQNARPQYARPPGGAMHAAPAARPPGGGAAGARPGGHPGGRPPF